MSLRSVESLEGVGEGILIEVGDFSEEALAQGSMANNFTLEKTSIERCFMHRISHIITYYDVFYINTDVIVKVKKVKSTASLGDWSE